jgi:drug/metabolite transporter (DMT)-like permease
MIEFLSYIFYFVAATISPLQKRFITVKRNVDDHSQINFSFKVFCFLVLGSLFFPLFSPFYLKGNIWYLVGLSLICGVLGMFSFIFSYTSQKYIEGGATSVIGNIYVPLTIILSSFFLHESLTLVQIFGTVLLLMGVVIVSQKHRIGKFKFDKYFTMMVAGAIMLGCFLVAERALQKTTGFSAGTMLSWWSQCFFLGIAVLITKSKNAYSRKDITITGVLSFIQSLSWVVLVFTVGNLSIVSAVTTFKIIFIFIGAAIFLKERDNIPRKIIGSLLALVGLFLMK